MILGLFLDQLGIKAVPLILEILSGAVLVAGVAFMIFRYIFEKGESDIDPVLFKKISTIAAWVFIGYACVELIAAAACIAVNEACRNNYHVDITNCKFCMIDPNFKKNNHSAASDCLTLGVYFDAFIVNAYVTNCIKIIKEKIDEKRKDH